ncbi:hypothetical protein LX69_01097 [Breznakibacter xylanolyticus]|uniref:Lumazine-binding protein n=1 Tax=Breznakibacter xylanolyticus TaxID=990 RepID=A0A2W7NCF9_9BACT|nr:hypothetical protein [Breznakibacter xylanolyticus]PZX18061.1 hypothetical protein LX69_01097 [Breznakibacter xylanolyticus]
MKFIPFFLLMLLFSSCTAKRTCDSVLDAAKDGRLYYAIGNSNSIHFNYWDLITHPPKEDTSRMESRIMIPQNFDSYEFIAEEEIGMDTLIRHVNLNSFSDLTTEGIKIVKDIYMNKDGATLVNDSIIKYTEAPAPIRQITYRLSFGNQSSVQMFMCLKTSDGWKVFSSVNHLN